MLKNNKMIVILSVLLIFLLALGTASANEDNNQIDETNIDLCGMDVVDTTNSIDINNNVNIYVNGSVKTSGDGSQDKPYKTIKEAIGVTNASENTIIHIVNGVYNSADNLGLAIDLDHVGSGGSLSLIGESKEKTIIDLSLGQFMNIKNNAIVFIKNLEFINGITNNIPIYSVGNLTVDNCIFENCTGGASAVIYASSSKLYCYNSSFKNIQPSYGGKTLYVDGTLGFIVDNCSFDNCLSGQGIVIGMTCGNISNSNFTNYEYAISISGSQTVSSNINNCLFINSTKNQAYNGAAIAITGYNANICVNIGDCLFVNNSATQWGGAINGGSSKYVNATNCIFMNNSANQYGGAIYKVNAKNCIFENCTASKSGGAIYDGYFENNTIINCYSPKDKGIFVSAKGTSPNIICILENKTVDVNNKQILLSATITDNNNNPISGSANSIFSFILDDKQYTLKEFTNGTVQYIVNKILYGSNVVSAIFNPNSEVREATLIVNVPENAIIYVATEGNDETGDGSKDKPYATLIKAINAANAINNKIFIKSGNYVVNNSIEINTAGGNLTLIGYGGEVIIDFNKNKNGIEIRGDSSYVYLSNLTFVNCSSTYVILNEGILTISNCNFINNTPTYSTIWNNKGVLKVIKSNFSNNKPTSSGYGDITILNGKVEFINTTFEGIKSNSMPLIYEYSVSTLFFVENCTFKYQQAIRSQYKGMLIKNSTFINCSSTSSGGAIQISSGGANLINNAFINCSASSGGAISTSGTVILVNNTFINCSASGSGAAVYVNGDITLLTNNVINCTSNNDNFIYVYTKGKINSLVKIVVLNNETIDVESYGYLFKVNIFDDKNNPIIVYRGQFYLNDENIGNSKIANKELVLDYKNLLNGTYIVDYKTSYLTNTTVEKATLKITPLVNSEIWVNVTGSDETGDGSKDNPYKTIDKSFESAQALNNVIHIGEGTFNLSNPLAIDTQGGKLTFIGKGDKTIIDLEKEGRFIDSISANSIVEIINMTIINGYMAANGGTIMSAGDLTINRVTFINSTSNGSSNAKSRGGTIYNTGKLTLLNSKFINSTAKQGGVIYNTGTLYLKNNTMINATAPTGQYIQTTQPINNAIIVVMENKTWDISTSTINLNATVTDDMGNLISGGTISFILSGSEVATATITNGLASTTITKNLNGNFVVSAEYGTNSTVKNAIININNPSVLTNVWIAVDGDDVNGDGSELKPFKTFEKVFSVASMVNAIIHVKNGEYKVNNIVTISNFNNLTIKGEGSNVIINGSNQYQLFKIEDSSSVNFVNLRLTSVHMNENVANPGAIINNGKLNIINSTLDNISFIIGGWQYSGFAGATVIYNAGELNIFNCTFADNKFGVSYCSSAVRGGLIYSTGDMKIINSTFVDNKCNAGVNLYGGIIDASGNLIVDGSKFVNNQMVASSYAYGGIISSSKYLFVNNSLFESNTLKGEYASEYYGSAICSYKLSNGPNTILEIYNSNFIRNLIDGYKKCTVVGSHDNKIINCTFKENDGVFSLTNGIIDGCKIIDNNDYILSTYSLQGVTSKIGIINITNCNINSSTENQKGFQITNGELHVSNCNISNIVGDNGGVLTTGTGSSTSSKAFVFNNTIESCVAAYGAIAYFGGNSVLTIYNNTLRNNKANIVGDYIYLKNNAKINGSKYMLIFGDNSTIINEGSVYSVNATLVDINGNIIYGANVEFKFNSSEVGSTTIEGNGYATLNGAFVGTGKYVLSGSSNNILNPNDLFVKNALITFTSVLNKIVYVDSVLGSDANDGSKEKPYLTLSKGISEASKAVNGTVYVMPGTYTGDLNKNIEIILAQNSTLTIIGLNDNDKVFINLDDGSEYLFDIKSSLGNSSIIIKNMNIKDGNMVLNNVNLTLESVSILNKKIIINSKFSNISFINVSSIINSTSGYGFSLHASNLTVINSSISNSSVGQLFYVTGIQPASGLNFIPCQIEILDSELTNNNIQYLMYLVSTQGYSAPNSPNHKINIHNSIIVNNTFNQVLFSLYSSDLLISNSVIYNNTPNYLFAIYDSGYGSNNVVVNNNWWGTNNNPIKIDKLSTQTIYIKDWIVVELTTNNTDIKVGDKVSLDITFKSSNGSALKDNVPTRFAEFMGNATFNGLDNVTVAMVNNTARVNAVATAPGVIRASVDGQVFQLNVTAVATSINAENITVEYNKPIQVNVTVLDEANNPISGLTVKVDFNGKNYTAVTNDKGIAVFDLDKAPADNYTFKYCFEGNNAYMASNGTGRITVTKAKSNVNVTANDVLAGDDLTVYVVVENGTSGVVNISVNGTKKSAAIVNGKANATFAGLAVGSYAVKVEYAGDGNFLADSATTTMEVSDIPIISDVNVENAEIGEDVVVEAVISTGATGNITFDVNGTKKSAAIVNGKATATFTGLGIGKYNVTATYDFKGSIISKSATFNVSKINATINLNAITNVNATDNVVVGGSSNLIGENITLTINNQTVTVNVGNDGNFSYTLENVSEGEYTIKATYKGSDRFSNATSNVVTFNASKVKAEITLNAISNTTNVVIKGSSNLIGENITISVNNRTYIVKVASNGTFSYELGKLKAGNYTVKANYDGSDKFTNATSSTVNFTVDKVTVNVNVTAEDIMEGDEAIITVTFTPEINGTVSITVNNKTYNVDVVNGTATLEVPDLKLGVYLADANYLGDEEYTSASGSAEFNVTVNTKPRFDSDDIVMYFKNGTRWYATLRDAKGNLMPGANITMELNGIVSNRTLNANATTSMALNLPAGNYTGILTYREGNMSSVKKVKITILPVVFTNDTVLYYHNGTKFNALFLDGQGNPLVNASVKFNINGVIYNRTTNANGTTSGISLNLPVGNYTVTAFNPANDAATSSNVIILSTINGDDLVMYYRNGTKYNALFLDGQGNPLVNASVKFNINGLIYNRTTNENGTTSGVNLNLPAGDYVITAIGANGQMFSNNVTIMPTIITENIVKYYKNDTQYEMKVVDGKGNILANQTISLNINGVFYNRTTNENGSAVFKINLPAGSNQPNVYVITATCNDCIVSNNVTVLPTLTGENVDGKSGEVKYNIKLVDGEGKPLAGKVVGLNINGELYNRTTNAEGTTSGLTINLPEGKYIITARDFESGAITSNEVIITA